MMETTVDLLNKVVMITGSTDGLGKLAALRMARRGATLILHGRDSRKGQSVASEVKRVSGNERVEYVNADLASLDEVRDMADALASTHHRLDILINNAGLGGGPRGNARREISRDGIEMRFQVNYLSHFLLTHRLLPMLKAAVPSRIINVSSIGQHPIDFEDVMLVNGYDSFRAYRQSKLAQIMFTIDLAGELKGSGVTVNALHPATLMNTNMVHEFFGSTMSTVEDGADALEYVSTSPEIVEVTGAYYDQKRKSKANPQVYDPEARRKLRELSLALTGLNGGGPK